MAGTDGEVGYAQVPTSTPVEEAPPRKGAPCRTWVRFFTIWVCCGLSAGVLPGQSLFIKLFADEGIFGSLCEASVEARHGGEHGMHDKHRHTERLLKEHAVNETEAHTLHDKGHAPHDSEGDADDFGCKEQYLALTAIMQTGQTLALMFLAPIGLFFDSWGAQKTGSVGAATCCLGVIGLWGSVVGAQHGYDQYTSYAFVAGLFICDFGSLLNSYALMGLIWHFPGQQALVLSLFTSSYQVSAFLPILFEAIIALTGVNFSWMMFSYIWVCLFVTWACWMLVPTQAEYYGEAKRVLGMPLPRPPHDIKPLLMLKRAWSVLLRDTKDHVASGLALAVGFGFPSIYQSFAAPYGEVLFGSKEDGKHLAELYVSVNGLVGLILAPFCGAFADYFGLPAFIILLSMIEAMAAVTCGLADWVAQTVCACAIVLFMTLVQIFSGRYMLLYSPPNRIGTVQGIYYVVVLTMSMPLTFGAFAFIELLPTGPDAYRIPMWICGTLGTIALAVYVIYFCQHPAPDTPVLLQEDEVELSRNFGCGNLDEVGQVVHIPDRKDLIKKLSSTDPDVLRELIQSIDTAKMLEMMAQRPLEDLATMMEEGLVGEEDEEELEAEAAGVARAEGTTEVGLAMAESVELNDKGTNGEKASDAAEDGGAEKAAAGTEEAAEESDAEKERRRIREIGETWSKMIEAKDKEGVKKFLLESDIEDMWAMVLDSEERQTEAERKKQDKEFDKLVPGKEFAKILRQRAELRVFVQRLMKRELDRKIASMRGKKK